MSIKPQPLIGGGSAAAPAIVQSAFNGGANIQGVVFGTAPKAGNLLIAFCNGNASNAGAGWNGPYLQDGGGVDFLYLYWKIAGSGESTAQNPVNAANQNCIGIYEISGTNVPSLASFFNTNSAAPAISLSASHAASVVVGVCINTSTTDVPTGIVGATADGTANNGSNRSIAGFHIIGPAAGYQSNVVTVNYAGAHNISMAGAAAG